MSTRLVAGVDCSTQSTKVLVVDVENGEIKEIGDHNSLNKSGGYYRRLYEMQNKNILT